jgi:hypothetical protein
MFFFLFFFDNSMLTRLYMSIFVIYDALATISDVGGV